MRKLETGRDGETVVVGFDSAWTDKPLAPGAICAIRSRSNGLWHMQEPQLASFSGALTMIQDEARAVDRCLVAIDQPTIVPNLSGSRPVDKVSGSLVSFVGGGVQPANRSKIGMFDDGAPIWRFLSQLGAVDDPEQARASDTGLFLMEVFPALALPSLDPSFHGRLAGARYNPARRSSYRAVDWHRVIGAAARVGARLQIEGVAAWCGRHQSIGIPRKADQDLLDAVLCALIGVFWLSEERTNSIIIGDAANGYMVAPATAEVRARLTRAAAARLVPVDGVVPLAQLAGSSLPPQFPM
jgi:predicted RNase H-like nuclease